MSRVWSDINGFPNYRVSDDGLIENKKTGRQLRTSNNNSGYQTVNLYNNGTRATKGVHRLVAETYVDGYHDGLEVNHLDGDKQNNSKENLEWVTHSANEFHAHRTGLKHGPNRKPIRIVETGEVFESINECARAIDGDDAHIGACLNGKSKTHLGLSFEYADVNDVNSNATHGSKSIEYVIRRPRTIPIRIVETGEVFESINECARAIDGDQPTITGCLKGRHKTHKGYHYEYME